MNKRFPKKYDFKSYNKKDYIELLKLKQLNHPYNQAYLLYHSAIQYSLLVWETRDQFFALVEKFFNKEMNFFVFCVEIENLSERLDKVCTNLEDNLVILSPLEHAADFCNLIDEIYDFCESLEPESFVFKNNGAPNPVHNYELSDEFQEELKTLYHKAKNFADMNS